MTNITSGRPASYSSNTSAKALQRPGQNPFAEFGDLLAVLQHDGILADQIDAADMAVQIDAHAGPVQPRRDLFDMGRFAGAVIAWIMTRRLWAKPARMASVVSRSKR